MQSLMENLKPWIASPPERLWINGKSYAKIRDQVIAKQAAK